MTPDTLSRILDSADAGTSVADIAAYVGVSVSSVYAVLRKHRPNRQRSPRARTSDLPAKIIALHKSNVKAARIAVVCKVSRAYVYRTLAGTS